MTDRILLDEKTSLLPRLSRAIVVIAALGLTGAMAGCADIHPAGDDTEEGMLGSPTDEAEDEQRVFERENEEGREAEENQNR